MATKKTGRPSKLTPELIERVEELMAGGRGINSTCGLLGISPSLYYLWQERGKREQDRLLAGRANTKARERERVYLEFLEAITRGKAAKTARAEQTITALVAEGDFKAAAWWLERTEREEYGKSDVAASKSELDEEKSALAKTMRAFLVTPVD